MERFKLLDDYRDAKKNGMTEKEFANSIGMSVLEFREKRSELAAERRAIYIAKTAELKAKGWTNMAISQELYGDTNHEVTIRNYIKEIENMNITKIEEEKKEFDIKDFLKNNWKELALGTGLALVGIGTIKNSIELKEHKKVGYGNLEWIANTFNFFAKKMNLTEEEWEPAFVWDAGATEEEIKKIADKAKEVYDSIEV